MFAPCWAASTAASGRWWQLQQFELGAASRQLRGRMQVAKEREHRMRLEAKLESYNF